MGDKVEPYDMSGISIIIPAYNSVNFIEECLMSIEKQTYFENNDKYEIIVGVDGCLGTLNEIKSIKDKISNLKILWMEKNMGSYVTINTLIPETLYGHIIKFDSDDVMKPNLIERVMGNEKNYDIIQFKYHPFKYRVDEKRSNSSLGPAMGALYYKKQLFDICGGYSSIRFSSDLELLTRVNNFIEILSLNEPLFYYRTHPSNLTSTVPIKDRVVVDNGIRKKNYAKNDLKITPEVNDITLKIE